MNIFFYVATLCNHLTYTFQYFFLNLSGTYGILQLRIWFAKSLLIQSSTLGIGSLVWPENYQHVMFDIRGMGLDVGHRVFYFLKVEAI
jgi:hypothetical protein